MATEEQDVGGLVAWPPDQPLSRRQKFRLLGLVILKRLRFIAILAAVGLLVGYWDTVLNYWDKWTRPQSAVVRRLEPGEEFFCPMDPQVHQEEYAPNGDVPKCPICGMPLSIRKKGEAARLPAGITARVQLSPERIQLAGIKTAAVEYRPMARVTKTVGYIAFDESGLSRIVSRVDGYVEKLYVDETFTIVHKGDPLAEIYSPELYSAARELVLATRAGGLSDLAAAARTKLLLLGVSQEEVDGIVASGQPSPRLVIRSPQEGHVVAKRVVVGASVEAKMTLFEVADLSTVWVEADVYEKDIAFLQVGQQVEVTVAAWPDRTFHGKLALIYPQLEIATRTNRIRLKLDNSGHELRPGMFATVRINTPLEDVEPFKGLAQASPLSFGESARVRAASQQEEVSVPAFPGTGPHPDSLPKGEGTSPNPPRPEFLTVPERAVVDTGSRKVVYVERKPGLFEGVEVVLGPGQGGYYPVIQGLNPGDKVAAAGGFLIDAETRLNPAAASTYFGASGGPQASSQPGSRGATAEPRSATAGLPTEPQAPRAVAGLPTEPQGGPKVSENAGDLRSAAAAGSGDPRRAGEDLRRAPATPSAEDCKNIAKLPKDDRPLALAQGACPITGAALGSMGVPVKIMLRGRPVFLCCQGCVDKAKRNPEQTLETLAKYAAAGKSASAEHR